MYFKDKNNTNIDKEFNNNNDVLSSVLSTINKYKIFLIIGLLLIIIIFIFLLSKPKAINYLELIGDDVVTIYQDADYIEPGYKAYNSRNEDLISNVIVESNVNNDVIGEYKITYTLGKIVKTRIINVIEKPKEYTFIYLNTVNNNVNIYLKIGEEYKEPGYQVFSTTGTDLTNKVTITGKVDTSKKGNYKLVYSVTDSNNVTISASRTVIVMDSEINLSLDNSNYTNKEVIIKALAIDEYFDYMILPDNTKVTTNTYSYKVSNNGKYTFTVYNNKGYSKTSTIEVKNIDKTAPTGSCSIEQYEDKSNIIINASDLSGISKYI